MQSADPLSPLPFGEDESGFKRRVAQERWRRLLDETDPRPVYTARMATGYGKTESIIDGYDRLRERHRASRLLIVVPTTTQEDAYRDSLQRKARYMGIHISGAYVADSVPRIVRAHRRNEAEVFIITVQRLVSSVGFKNARGNWLYELLETGAWVGAADEYHHYALENLWGQVLQSLTQIRQWMALSATPERKQGSTIFGAPLITVSYADALNEKTVVKDVKLKVREYGVDIALENTDAPLRVTTSQLREQIGNEPVDKFEARKQLRYLTKYCTPILQHATAELEALYLDAPTGARPQMLVYAFSCAHAKSLCTLVSALAPGFTVDWAGTGPNGRSQADNDRVVSSFLDTYKADGKTVDREHTLDILIQVNIAAEGFDSRPVCVIADLSLTGFSPQKIQAYGRGSRFYYNMLLTIFVPTDSNVAALAATYGNEPYRLFDEPVDTRPPGDGCECCEACPNCLHHREGPKELPPFDVIDALLIGGVDYEPSKETVVGTAADMGTMMGRTLDPLHNRADYETVTDILRKHQQRLRSEQSTMMQLDHWTQKVRRAVGLTARNVLLATDGFVEKSKLGDLCKAINTQWRIAVAAHDAMTITDFQNKYRWLEGINKAIVLGNIPTWLK